MQYFGGKSRLARQFAPVLDESLDRTGGILIEPFVGGFNIVPALTRVRGAGCTDLHPGLLALYRALQSGWQPPREVTEAEYAAERARDEWDARRAFVAFGCSFAGKEWGGYARNAKGDNYADCSARSLLRKFSTKVPVVFAGVDYRVVRASTRSTFYCDPPYRGTTGYRTGAWDPAAFDTWCEARARESHEVFVSEFTAPPHWPVVWEKVRRETCSGGTGGDRLDRLYRVVPR